MPACPAAGLHIQFSFRIEYTGKRVNTRTQRAQMVAPRAREPNMSAMMAAPSFQDTGWATRPAASLLDELEALAALLLLDFTEETEEVIEAAFEEVDDRDDTEEAATLSAETRLLIVIAEDEGIVM